MTMKSRMIFLCCLLLIGLSPFAPFSRAGEKILILTNTYEPYYGETLENFGPFLQIAILAFQEAGYEPDVKFLPWARVVREGEKGGCDVIAGVWVNDGREHWMALTDPILENEIGFFKRKNDDIVFTDFPDLKARNIVVGTVRGYINPEGLTQAGVMTEEVTEDALNVRKLAGGRIRLALMDKYLGLHLARKEGVADKLEWLVTLKKLPLRNGIMKTAQGDWKKKLDDFNEGLNVLKQKGTVTQVLGEFRLHP